MHKFIVTKIGLLNFWLYDEEEYDFYGGNLILRGSNGSGKSVTMQSFIPLILDGNKAPDRLDPFGSKDRKIEDYIIGDSESLQKEEATSYLYMETFNQKENRYITIGLGFRGRKGKSVDSWGFALKDGKRINKDFFLYKDALNKVPLSKGELKSRLGESNEFTDITKDYKAMVNRLLFGFSNLDVYDEFIKLLLQLRSNKLSKDYKPTNLINVLNTVLQPLSEEDLRPLSEAIEEMNKTKERLEKLEKNSKILKEFLKSYNNYNQVMLTIKARNYKQSSDSYKKIKSEHNSLTEELSNLKSTLETQKQLYNETIQKIEIAKETKRQLDNTDLKNKIESLATLKENINNLNQKIEILNSKIDKSNEERITLNKKISDTESEEYKLRKELEEIAFDLKDLATETYFDEMIFFIDDLLNSLTENISFASIQMSLKSYQETINSILELLELENRIIMETESSQVELNKLVKQYEFLEKDLSNLEKSFNDNISKWEEDFANLKNIELVLSNQTKAEIYKIVNNTTIDNYQSDFKRVSKLYLDYGTYLKSNLISENLKLEHKQLTYQNDKNELQKQLEELKKQEDIELNNTDINIDAILNESNIKHISLYKCLEFKDNISEEAKNKIESNLLNLNILGAKIIGNEDLNKVKNLNTKILYLKESTYKKNNLLKYFNINLPNDSQIKKEQIEKILQSFSIDNDDLVSINEMGARIDILNTLPDSNYTQSFIGYFKRIELKNKKIKELEDKIESINKQITNLNNIISQNENKIALLEEEITKLPNIDGLNEIADTVKEKKLSLIWNDKNQKEIEKKLEEKNAEIKIIKEKILIKKKNINIPLNITSFKNTSDKVMAMQMSVNSLKTSYNNYQNKIELKLLLEEKINDLIDNIADIEADLSEKTQKLNINIANSKMIEELLNQKEYIEQRDKLVNIENDLRNYEKDEKNYNDSIIQLKTTLNLKEEKQKEIEKQVSTNASLMDIYEKIFIREYKLGYLYQDEIQNIDTTIKRVLNDNLEIKDTTPSNSLSKFYDSFHRYSLDLNDYSLKNVTLFNDNETDNEEFRSIFEENIRADVSAMYEGVKLNLIDLYAELQNEIENSKNLISKQDRQLFEDILLNTVGEKIRNRINSSNEWVSKINSIMSTMQENSALRFKLVWKSIQASNEDEIDTKEIVRILKLDPTLVKESDSEKLTNHFRSRIKKAEEQNFDSYISFFKIIEEVLDYRSWFTFKLEYQRSGEDYRELTDKTFSKFSGGERAKSMYIPLFASVYAKLNLARKNSLRLIALDEAFAGVDEENIREMFGILKYLDLNFVINSQALWGDYDTIENLSICELIRPNNSQTVTVERYRWNGKYKEIIEDRKKYNEELNA